MKQNLRAKRMARHHKRLASQSKLNLVSLMDIFTILVFFLLVNSSDVEVLQKNKEIKLPESVAEKKPEDNLIVMVSNESVMVGGRKIADVKAIINSDSAEIKPLVEELDHRAKLRLARNPYRSEEEEKLGLNITIMGDHAIPYALLKRIMTTCAKSEYRNLSLAVNQVPDDSGAALEASLGGE